jgi:1-pyrroline-5-carboxylate dehydrogenase
MSTAQLSTVILPLAPQGVFRNEPFTNFADSQNAHAMRAELQRVEDMLGHEYEMVIGGERVRTAIKTNSINPAEPARVVGIHQSAGVEHVELAMSAALKAFESWQYVSVEERTSLLLRAAQIIRERKFEFCAWLTYEVGKNWAEADADVAETIDFLEFYAREALRLAAATTPIQYPGERNELLYLPLGVGAVIPPWNFPFAIAAGMTAAAIVTGNTVILKPSSDAPTIAARFMDVLEEAGMPPGVVNFCHGLGETFGAAIVEHPRTRFIAFTGSKRVGLHIHEHAAKTQPGQIWIKRTILEMGGKDAIIVGADCNFDDAVDAVIASAFGFNGQKCSACSRAIVEAPIYESFVDAIREKVAAIQVGDPVANKAMGPVINKVAYDRVRAGHSRRPSYRRRQPCQEQRRRILHRTDSFCRRRAPRAHCTRGDLRPRPGHHQSRYLRGCPADCQRYRVRSHRRRLYRRPGKTGCCTSALPRRQSLLQSQMHRRHGWRPSLWRLQHVRH